MDLTIAAFPNAPEDKAIVVFGFSSDEFSQAVYMQVPDDVQQCIAYADELYKNFIQACADAVKAKKNAQAVKGTFRNNE